jgi:alkanesulfonate monooxygenase SsuD/methylene tetrahydromethanopterin reductase-like flavin-dependent oxidoreductase (luciferase family)
MAGKGKKTGPSEEMKARFRAALDKKKETRAGTDISHDGEHSKVHGEHGPAKAQQMFRRKSGG